MAINPNHPSIKHKLIRGEHENTFEPSNNKIHRPAQISKKAFSAVSLPTPYNKDTKTVNNDERQRIHSMKEKWKTDPKNNPYPHTYN